MDAIWSARRYGEHFDFLTNKGKQILKAASNKASSNKAVISTGKPRKMMKSAGNGRMGYLHHGDDSDRKTYLQQEECLMAPSIHLGIQDDPNEDQDQLHHKPLCSPTIKKMQ